MNFILEKDESSLASDTEVSNIECAAWLSQGLLLAISLDSGEEERNQTNLIKGSGLASGSSHRAIRLVSPQYNEILTVSLFILQDEEISSGLQSSQWEVDSRAIPHLDDVIVDLKSMLRQYLAPLGAADRKRVLAWLTEAMCALKSQTVTLLGENLLLIREALRERLPAGVISPDLHQGMHVDHLFRIDERSFYIRGWASAASGPLASLTVVSPEGFRVDITNRAFWYPREDIGQLYNIPTDRPELLKTGFLCYFELPRQCTLPQGWLLEAIESDGKAFEVTTPEVSSDLKMAKQFLLCDPSLELLPAQELRSSHILPAISHLQERSRQGNRLNWVQQYGRPPVNPKVSIIVPLYRRVDFLEHQLAQFVHDSEIRNADLIYILDSPELGDGLRSTAAALYELYRIPFRLGVVQANAGFAGVNNLGAELARSRLLLLLNSDILPDAPGWLERLITLHDSKPNLGACGVKLLFEDDTIQHAGLYFRRSPQNGLWENQHFFKGLDRNLPMACKAREVPAVSAACLMIDRDLYLELGGLRGIYVQGDYEDSDLCLRLREAGREIWYFPQIELYHLEGQSYPSDDRNRNLMLNRWMHTWFWNQAIEALINCSPLNRKSI